MDCHKIFPTHFCVIAFRWEEYFLRLFYEIKSCLSIQRLIHFNNYYKRLGDQSCIFTNKKPARASSLADSSRYYLADISLHRTFHYGS